MQAEQSEEQLWDIQRREALLRICVFGQSCSGHRQPAEEPHLEDGVFLTPSRSASSTSAPDCGLQASVALSLSIVYRPLVLHLCFCSTQLGPGTEERPNPVSSEPSPPYALPSTGPASGPQHSRAGQGDAGVRATRPGRRAPGQGTLRYGEGRERLPGTVKALQKGGAGQISLLEGTLWGP